MSFQIILVISSPSSSTTGFLTLIFLKEVDMLRRCRLTTCEATALEDCCAALKMAGLEVEEKVVAEARKQRKVELFITTRKSAHGDYKSLHLDPSSARPEWTAAVVSRSRLLDTGLGAGGVTVSAAMFVVASFAGCNVVSGRGAGQVQRPEEEGNVLLRLGMANCRDQSVNRG
jgi:hypothetical protein